MVLTANRAAQSARDRADGTLARVAANYLSLVTPEDGAAGLDAPRLLSNASALAGFWFWDAGLQAALGNAPLLPDTIGLGALPGRTLAEVESHEDPVLLRRHASVSVAVVRLLDHGFQRPVGWVGVWNSVPRQGRAMQGVALFLLAALTVGFATFARSWWWATFGAVAAVLLALRLGLDVRGTAVRATDGTLLRAGRLIEIAASAEGVTDSTLPWIVSGARTMAVPLPGERDDTVRREFVEGRLHAVVVASLYGGTGLKISALAGESRLGLVWTALAGWGAVALLALIAMSRSIPAPPRLDDEAGAGY